jgi:hypothetical protein
LLIAASTAFTLQGCETKKGCKIDDVYGLIQVEGRTGWTRSQLEKVGIKLCARHLKKEETYENDACMETGEVFADGELPTTANGDVNALLLVRCPSSAYPKGKELQRVTCSDDFMGEDEDGDIEQALHIRFDNYERASNCKLADNVTVDELLDDDSSEANQPDTPDTLAKGVEFFKELDRATEEAHSRAIESNLGPAVLGRKERHAPAHQALSKAGTVLTDSGVSIHPHGMITMGHPRKSRVHLDRQREREHDGSNEEGKPGIIRSAVASLK